MNRQNRQVLIVVAALVVAAFSIAWLAPQPPPVESVGLADSQITMVENNYTRVGGLQFSHSETIAVNAAEGKILKTRRTILPALDQDSTDSEVINLEDNTITRWHTRLHMKTISQMPEMSRSQREAWWSQQGCGTVPAPHPDERNSDEREINFLGLVTLQPGNVKAYGLEIREFRALSENDDPTAPLYTTRTIYRAPQFGCAEVKSISTATLRNGSRLRFNEKEIVAYSPGSGDASFEAPPEYKEVSRAVMRSELRAQYSRM